MKKLFNIIIFLSVLIIPFSVKATSYPYTIDSYDVEINVNKDNVLDITEKLGVYFSEERHGIYRTIPTKNKVTRLDGTTSYNRVKIKNISVSDNYTISRDGNNKVIKIGSSDKVITGTKDYTIKYSYNLGKDPSKDYDELYFNIIGSNWDTSISNVTFKITMPDSFDASKLGFASGKYGSTSNDVVYNVDGNVISGTLNKTLNPGESLTVRLELPEGYFVGSSDNYDLLMILGLILPILFVIIAYLLWNKYGKDDKAVETVEFYPPNGLNSAEVGFMYNGYATKNDAVSLLIFLANKGYLKINEKENKKLIGKQKDFELVKLKEYDGNNEYERLFLEKLFKSGDTVTKKDLQDKFYLTISKIVSGLNKKSNMDKIYEHVSILPSFMMIIMLILTYLLTSCRQVIEYNDGDMSLIVFNLVFILIISIIARSSTSKASIIVVVTIFIIFWLITSMICMISALIESPIYTPLFIVGSICMVIIIWLLAAMKKRNKYGIEMLGKLGGFKNFLKTAEKSKLEMMVNDNPTYFYDILPYAYVLGVSDKWIKQFEDIAIEPPDWYYGYSNFDVNDFGFFINSTLANGITSVSASTSSGSGFSGGGFSGGGSGGGGGGSW